MIELTETVDYIVMILVAAGVGAVGGLAYELLTERARNTGTIELPGRLKGTRFFDLGFPASLIIGAIAAAAILYFFPPTMETVTAAATPDEEPTTTIEYDLVKLVALSLIVGSAGPSFLAVAQSRVLAALNEQRAGSAVTAGTAQVSQVAESATAAVPAAVAGAIARHLPQANAEEVREVTRDAAAALEETIKPQVSAARYTIESVGQTPPPAPADGVNA